MAGAVVVVTGGLAVVVDVDVDVDVVLVVPDAIVVEDVVGVEGVVLQAAAVAPTTAAMATVRAQRARRDGVIDPLWQMGGGSPGPWRRGDDGAPPCAPREKKEAAWRCASASASASASGRVARPSPSRRGSAPC